VVKINREEFDALRVQLPVTGAGDKAMGTANALTLLPGDL
jgi:hypothetical protein